MSTLQKGGPSGNTPELPEHAWTLSVKEVCRVLAADPEQGLSEAEIHSRRKRFGANSLDTGKRQGTLPILWRQFQSVIMLVLAAAATLSFLFSQWIDGIAVLTAMFINVIIGFATELRAVRSMEALEQMDARYAHVIRGGAVREVMAARLVPGDVLVIESGDVVTADVRLTEANRLLIDESALTGESVPVTKQTDAVVPDAPIAERSSMLFKGTAVTEGSGRGVVVATGMQTELGAVAGMVQETEEESDPLSRRLNGLAARLVRVIVIAAVVAAAAGVLAGRELFVMIETVVALIVAAVPEGLPIVATLALARGMQRMARRNALIRRLSAVQTLGSTNVIFTDKTGTLTENSMTVTRLLLPGAEVSVTGTGLELTGTFLVEGEPISALENPVAASALRVAALCNNARLPGTEQSSMGDPLEVALVVAAAKAGLSRRDAARKWPEVRELAFDPDLQMMATVHQDGSAYWIAVKGAPRAVLNVCSRVKEKGRLRDFGDEEKEEWLARNSSLAGDGLRVLALAEKSAERSEDDVYTDLVFLGLAGMVDPPREEVRDAIAVCHRAGLRVVMVTGDQRETALAVGRALGVSDDESSVFEGDRILEPSQMSHAQKRQIREGSIFVRVSPEQKLNLVALHQEAGSIVAMTGDGVNDAPALGKADIGIAMGKRGEQVAEDAADMILQDDRFATITTAVEYGRIIFKNIRNFVIYLISGNIAEILAVGLASMVGAPMPLLPLQILYLNAVNDIFPALALGVGKGSHLVMQEPPRDPGEPVLARRHWLALGGWGILIAAAVLAGFAFALTRLGYTEREAVTVSFVAISLARLWHVFNMRDAQTHVVINQITRNGFVWIALGICIVLILLALYVPVLRDVLKLATPEGLMWPLILGTSALPLLFGQLALILAGRFIRRNIS